MSRKRFTAEQKAEALAEFDSNGGNIALALRTLGYPDSYNTLKSWIRERDVGQGVSTVTRVHAAYPDEIRVRALELYKSGATNHEIITQLGLRDIGIVYYWLKAENRVSTPRRVRMPTRFDDADVPQMPVTEAGKASRIRELELENDILREVVDTLKAVSLNNLTNREKTLIIDALRQKTDRRLNELTVFLRISKSSYEYWRTHLDDVNIRDEIGDDIERIFHEEGNDARGYRFVHEVLTRERGEAVSEKIVRDVMRSRELTVVYKKKRKRYSSYAGEPDEGAPNMPLDEETEKHDFHADSPNQKWVTDITEFKLPDAPKVYLSPVIDLFVSGNVSTSSSAA